MCLSLPAFGKEIVAYYSNWSIYHPQYPLYAKDIPVDLVDTIIYAFVNVDEKGNISLSDPYSDNINLKDLPLLKEKAKQPGKKLTLLFSVGGWGKGSDPFPQLSTSITGRENFAKQAVAFCRHYQFDGMDIDWEFPKNEKQGEDFVLLLYEIFQTFKRTCPPLLLTAAVPGLPDHYKKIPWARTIPLLDRVHVMTYDLHGPWQDPENTITNHQCALKPTLLGSPLLNIKSVMEFYETFFPEKKLFVGIPLFFNTYANANEGIPPSHYGSPYSGPAENPLKTDDKGVFLYREVMKDLELKKAEGFWDSISLAFSVYYPHSQVFGSGINDQSLNSIGNYILSSKYRGAMIWELRGDTRDWHALKFLNDIFIGISHKFSTDSAIHTLSPSPAPPEGEIQHCPCHSEEQS